MNFTQLISWSESGDQGIKYYSGTARYERSFKVPQAWLKKGQPQQAVLCLEKVVQTLPGTRMSEVAQLCLSQIQGQPNRPVDYKRREEMLATLAAAGSLHALHPSDERLKLGVVQHLLNIRRSRAALFRGGSYTQLETRGSLATHLIAFMRGDEKDHAVVIAPRLLARVVPSESAIPDWGDTEIVLPNALRSASFHDVFRDQDLELSGDATSFTASRVLTGLPMAVLLSP